nr:serine/threonine-protein phosphatase 7-like [Tanacetum cinerariifolium]
MDSVDSDLDGSTPTATTEGDASCTQSILKRNSGDPGWNYGTLCDAENRETVKCKLCGFISKGGITRLKYHVAGIKRKGVATCKKASEEDKAVCASLVEKPKE